jgi:putative ABC transport system substrate-binding protein
LQGRSADGEPEALASLAADLIRSQVNIIVAYPTTAGLAVQKATADLPVVVYGGDLEATGLIANLARPGGNVTGVSAATAELAAKNLELIAEILPGTRRVAVFVNAASLFGAALLEHVQVAAQTRNIEIKSFSVREAGELEADFASIAEWKPDALLIHPALPQKLIADLANDQFDASSLLVSKIAQPLPKPLNKKQWIGISEKQNANLRDLALLGADREGPSYGRATQQCDEIAP